MPVCQWCHHLLRGLSNTGRPRRYCDTRCRVAHTATANSPTPTTSHGNDEPSPRAGDHQPPKTTHNITKYY
jgi:hypothetical protein